MAVAAANEQQRTDRALVGQLFGARDRGMEAVVEADLDDALVLAGGRKQRRDLGRPVGPPAFPPAHGVRPRRRRARSAPAGRAASRSIRHRHRRRSPRASRQRRARRSVAPARARRSAIGIAHRDDLMPCRRGGPLRADKSASDDHQPHLAVSPGLAAVLRHDAAQGIDVGPGDLLALLRRKRPGIPRAPRSAVRSARRFHGLRDSRRASAPTESGVPPSCFSLTMRACNAAPTRSGPADDQLVGQPRHQRTGRDGVDVDVPLPRFQRQRLGEADNSRLGGGVGADSRQRVGGAAAGQHQDLAVALRLESRERLARADRRCRSG